MVLVLGLFDEWFIGCLGVFCSSTSMVLFLCKRRLCCIENTRLSDVLAFRFVITGCIHEKREPSVRSGSYFRLRLSTLDLVLHGAC